MDKSLLFLDLEMNQPSEKIIQVGFIVMSSDLETMLDSKRIYVNPGEPLSPYIIQLTGITEQDILEGGHTLEQAYEKIKDSMLRYNCFINPVTWGGGDSECLRQQLGKEKERFLFGRRWIDAKTLFVSYGIANNLPFAGGLSKSLKRLGMEFVGRPHDALDDALNTFRIYKALCVKLKSLKN